MDSHKFKSTGSLKQQRDGMITALCLGHCREAEQHILNAVPMSLALKPSDIKVELHPGDPKSYLASVSTSTGEVISKKIDTLKDVNDWLLSMCESKNNGILEAGLKKVKATVKPQVEMEKAVDELMSSNHGAASSSSSKPTLDLGCESSLLKAPSEFVDVTAQFLGSKIESTVDLPSSTVCIHKGSLTNYRNIAYSNQSVYGVLFGKHAWNGKLHCTNVVLISDTARCVSAILENEQVMRHCKSIGLQCCGILLAGPSSHWKHEEHRQHALAGLECSENPILIVVDFDEKHTGEISCWELNMEENKTVPVSLSYTSNPHDVKKRLLYSICWLQDLGVGHIQHATSKICSALIKSLMEMNEKKKHQFQARKVFYRKVRVPADGLCGWYCLLAAQDPSAWEKIPRSEGSFPLNRQIHQQELNNAKTLHKDVCEKALTVCNESYHGAIRDVLAHPNFSPANLEWIAYTLSIAIRCTCDPKARSCQIPWGVDHLEHHKINMLHCVHTYMFIYK